MLHKICITVPIDHDFLCGILQVTNCLLPVYEEDNLCINMFPNDISASLDTHNPDLDFTNLTGFIRVDTLPILRYWRHQIIPAAHIEDQIQED